MARGSKGISRCECRSCLSRSAVCPSVAVVEMMEAFHSFLKHSPMMAYLAMMAPRLVELHRLLKPTGSLYLHCDPTASPYLRTILDNIFDAENLRNEIV